MEAALVCLDRIATDIEMPMMAWSPDVAQPYYSPEMDAFIRRQGWPEPMIELWREHSAGLKVRFYTRCRFTHLPFVTSLLQPGRRIARFPQSREERMAGEIARSLGLRSLLTVPVHLPRGQVSMLTWAGGRHPACAKILLEEVGSELLAVAHFAMQFLHKSATEGAHPSEVEIRLTPRERDCLRLTAQGYREADVARIIEIAPTTVRYHVDNVVEKLGASNRTHAVAIAAQLGLLGPISV
jgi:DNA-binding CsgD family transcriptional regulator